MRVLRIVAALLPMMMLAAAPWAGCAAEEDTTARLREQLHRTQEALRQAQSESAELARAKSDAEQKLQAATKDLGALQSNSKSAQTSLHSQLAAAQSSQEDLTHKLGDATERLTATSAKLKETATQLSARESELAQVKQGLELSRAAYAGCEDKNLKLYSYGQEVLQAYRKKGVWAALAQTDPVLGLKDVDVQNVVQEYRLKMAAEKIQSTAR